MVVYNLVGFKLYWRRGLTYVWEFRDIDGRFGWIMDDVEDGIRHGHHARSRIGCAIGRARDDSRLKHPLPETIEKRLNLGQIVGLIFLDGLPSTAPVPDPVGLPELEE